MPDNVKMKSPCGKCEEATCERRRSEKDAIRHTRYAWQCGCWKEIQSPTDEPELTISASCMPTTTTNIIFTDPTGNTTVVNLTNGLVTFTAVAPYCLLTITYSDGTVETHTFEKE